MLADLRLALRMLLKRPALTFVAALSLALGIGANSTIFSLLDGFYLRPLAVPAPGQIVRLFLSHPEDPYGYFSYPEFRELQRDAKSLSGLAASMNRGARYNDGQSTRTLLVNVVSPDFFQVLGVKPHLGRFFGPADESQPLIVVGYAAWQTVFGGDPALVGRTLRLNRGTVTVAGILPPEFRELKAAGDRHFWAPPSTWRTMSGGQTRDFDDPTFRVYQVLARRAPGVSDDQARAEVETIARRWQRPDNPRRGVLLSDFDWRWKNNGPTIASLFAIVALVVLIASVNVANLLLARAEARRREIAIRTAVGAPRWRLVRQFFVESSLLGAIAVALGLAIAFWLIEALPKMIPSAPGYSAAERFQLDLRVTLATLAVGAVTMLLFGLAPAFSATSVPKTMQRFPLRNILALSQVAVSLVLTVTAGALVLSFWNTRTAPVGFARKDLLLAWLSGEKSLQQTAIDRISALPGVTRVAVATRAPLSFSAGGMFLNVAVPGEPRPVEIKFNTVDPNYLPLMGTRLLRGRNFTNQDRGDAPTVALINEFMARRFWPNEDPIGKYIKVAGMAKGECQIVGIVENAPINDLTEDREPYFYLPYFQGAARWEMTLLIETAAPDPMTLASAVRSTLTGIDRSLEPMALTRFADLIRYSTRGYQVKAQLVTALGILGLILTAVGLYGVVSYSVSLRTREIGLRMALGAQTRQAAGLVLKQSLTLTALGLVIGVPLASFATTKMASLLFGLDPWHPPIYIAAAAILIAAAAAAAWPSARRASRIDPMTALRYE
ncbi:MAG: ABC transporter permease [Bryobacteraceae bacterium]|nr:ABC transporter permease [Bryobacteraceae bacterium]